MLTRVWWREDISGVTKNVAVALADAATDQGTCFPSVATLAIKSGWKPRAVQKALSELESMGLLRRITRKDSSSVYQFVLENMPLIERRQDSHKERDLFSPPAPDAPRPRTSCTPPVHDMHPPGAPDAPRTQSEPKEEPLLFGSETLPATKTEEEQIIDFVCEEWNKRAELHPGIAAARLPLNAARQQAIERRSKQVSTDAPTPMEVWRLFFRKIDASRFLQGRMPPTQKYPKPFSMDLTWALNATNFNKIMERRDERRDDPIPTAAADGRAMGTAEQATHLAISRRRAARERSAQRGDRSGAHA